MKLSVGLDVFFASAWLVALVTTFLSKESVASLSLQDPQAAVSRKTLLLGFLCLLGAYALAFFFHLGASAGFGYFLAGFLAWTGLSVLKVKGMMRGLLLLLGVFLLRSSLPEAEAVSLPLLSVLFGLTTGRFLKPTAHWEDYLWPVTALIGFYWMAIASPDSQQSLHSSLFVIFLSVSLLLRSLQSFSFFPKDSAFLRSLFVVVLAALGGWLGVQSFLLQPTLLNWVWLFTGAVLLGALLSLKTPLSTDVESETPSVLYGVIRLIGIGMMALIASRLFGTLGWAIIPIGILATPSLRSTGVIAILFFLGRVLLQGFIYQHNTNVTGINITHPYASAALYLGFILMLLMPAILNYWSLASRALTTDTTETLASDNTPPAPLLWVLLGGVWIAVGAIANYFLHAEATGSLLVALSVEAVGVSLIGLIKSPIARSYPPLLALMAINSALLTADLLEAGDIAEKSQKLLVLGAIVLLASALTLLAWKVISQNGSKSMSGGDAVQVS